jgi:hypothetical protein
LSLQISVIAVSGTFGIFSEISHAFGDNIPVISLNTLSCSRNEQTNENMTMTSNPAEAVSKDAVCRKEAISVVSHERVI